MVRYYVKAAWLDGCGRTWIGGRNMGRYSREMMDGWVRALGAQAGEEEGFLETLTEGLWDDPEAAEEFAYYMENGNFLCKMKVEGYTAVDILVWQIDHFKAQMDRGNMIWQITGGRWCCAHLILC